MAVVTGVEEKAGPSAPLFISPSAELNSPSQIRVRSDQGQDDDQPEPPGNLLSDES